ncbi:hypothetical protein SPRG_17619 [Saprolegnia parasitica CBS 223.65]|uniref:Uncharacterized protein n=1 Tax=Saprolegnia parasitica (strain CBS 223.65) TaxID=695850 RepID=A0A067BQF2_SAPPC|nr:hypothetical protein SPRG_17619 [Saprolegnia parasitica CBS 223.65]KDO16917.1 hypothetical protein SPRG_17619 [Saprolegnia parasitica CBS 223.65]|eukprot:XP_012212374.1 hypothetical protein SPRG_17619 [Saprolegnia parasitica CBS 223.65]
MECIYIDMQEQRLKMSPRAITDGWLYEMEAKIKAQRAKITAAKLDAVFGHGLQFRANVAKLQTLRRQRDDAIARRDEIERWRVEEYLDYWERDMHHMAILRARQRQQNIADERRKWHVKPCTKEGKVRLHAIARESTPCNTVPPPPHAMASERSTSVDPPPATDIVLKKTKKTKKKKKVETSGQQRRTRDAHVPWSLLDQLAAEKTKLQTEKALGAVFKRRKPIGDN